jgi:hypothetical protein
MSAMISFQVPPGANAQAIRFRQACQRPPLAIIKFLKSFSTFQPRKICTQFLAETERPGNVASCREGRVN